MARGPRIEMEGGIQHVWMRGVRGDAIFRDDRDRLFFLAELDISAKRYEWSWLSYCLMSNHVHLILETHQATLGAGMQRFAGLYAQWFNGRHGAYGHLFQGRYGSKLVDSDVYFAQLLRYVALNPVTAGLCSHPEAWEWSSHRHMLGRGRVAAHARSRVEGWLEPWGGRRGTRYARLFDRDSALADAFGSDDPSEHRPALQEILLASPGDEGLLVARRHGYRLAEIAAAAGVHESTVSRWLRDAS